MTTPCEAWEPLCESFPEGMDPAKQASVLMAATEVLWNRTKRQFGLCELTLRPCRKDCWPAWPWLPVTGWYDASSWTWPFPALVGGKWINLTCGSCGSHCSCDRLSEVVLPYPVAEVIEVKVDGAVLPASGYRVDDHRLLVRLGGAVWPRCNNLNLDDTEDGTWSVTAKYGREVPELGKMAVGQLATEIAKACVGAGDCKLPSATVRQVTRQGVTKVFFDSDAAFKRGKIGLYYPDLFIHTFNPSSTGFASIFDIDGPRRRLVGT